MRGERPGAADPRGGLTPMASRRIKRAGLAGAGLAGAGVAGGLAVRRAVARRFPRAPEVEPLGPPESAACVREHDVVVADGGSTHVIEQGPRTGPLVLLLHGITLSSAVWRYQLRDLSAAGYRAVAIDFRGHGRSVAGSEGLTIDRLAADVEEVITAPGPRLVCSSSAIPWAGWWRCGCWRGIRPVRPEPAG